MDSYKSLKLLKAGSIDRRVINTLIERCYKIALQYVRANSGKIFKQIRSEGEAIEDIAIEAVTPLFLYTEDNILQIIKAYNNWKNEINDEADALYFLNKIIARRVHQQITYVLKKSDPFFAKILDSVNYLIIKDGYKKQNYLGTVFIVEKRIDYKTIDHLTFETIPCKLFLNKDNMLKSIFEYIDTSTEYFPAIPVNSLVKKLKHINFNEYGNVDSQANYILKFDVKEAVEAGLNDALKKLNYSYNSNKKLNKTEIHSFEKTLKEIAFDLKDGGLRPGLYDYLKFNMPEIDKDYFHSRYQNILEYLLKIMKKKIAEKIRI